MKGEHQIDPFRTLREPGEDGTYGSGERAFKGEPTARELLDMIHDHGLVIVAAEGLPDESYRPMSADDVWSAVVDGN